MSDERDVVIKRVLAKLCEKNQKACPLVYEWANKKENEEKLWDRIREFICPEEDDNKCSMEFEKLKKEVMEDDGILGKQ